MGSLKRWDQHLRKSRNITILGGIDEAGRGALAGPVVAAVVLLSPDAALPRVNDSKQISESDRESMALEIMHAAEAASIGMATAEEVDRVNVLQATHLAVQRALSQLDTQPEFLVTDFLKLSSSPCPFEAMPKADSTSLCVASASILAKVARDRIMRLLDLEFPQYGLARHKGYGTPQHWSALEEHGPSTVHRLSFRGVGLFDAVPEVCSAGRTTRSHLRQAPPLDLRRIITEDFADVTPFIPEIEFITDHQR